ncbi:smalltalk protein [Bacteroides intestinalis]|nr:smalltalk protein [Bacteroides intestinalis]
MNETAWDKILKIVIAVASALLGALSAHAMTA